MNEIKQPFQAPRIRSNSSSLRALPTFLLLYPLMGLWLLQAYYLLVQPIWQLSEITALAVGSAFYGLLLAVLRGPSKLNFVVIYGIYLSLSHLGLVVTDHIFPDSLKVYMEVRNVPHSALFGWYLGVHTKNAVALSGFGIASFFLGAGIFTSFGRRLGSIKLDSISIQSSGNQAVFRASLIVLFLCNLYLLTMIAAGFLPLVTTYSDYRNSMIDVPYFPTFLTLLSVGVTFLLASGTKKQIMNLIIFYIIPALYLVINGNRGGVFYSLAAAIAVLSARGVVLKTKGVLLILAAYFIVIPVIGQIRNLSLEERNWNKVSVNLTDPFIELGFQLRPLTGTLQWIKNGEPFAYGGTYLLPLQRLISLVIPFIEREPIEGNRLDVQGRTLGQGYSVIAEAYFNFGTIGVGLILSIIGLFLSFANKSLTSKRLAFYGAVAAILINSQRNSFIFVPGQVTIVVIILILSNIFTKFKTSVYIRS